VFPCVNHWLTCICCSGKSLDSLKTVYTYQCYLYNFIITNYSMVVFVTRANSYHGYVVCWHLYWGNACGGKRVRWKYKDICETRRDYGILVKLGVKNHFFYNYISNIDMYTLFSSCQVTHTQSDFFYFAQDKIKL